MVMDNEDFKISSKSWSNPLPKPTYDEENDSKVITAYNDLISSEENQKLAYWKRDSSLMKVWDDEDWKLFEEAYKEFPDGPHSNRLIANKMGHGVHANHVAHYKKMYKKKLKE
jgi:hypothetical protein